MLTCRLLLTAGALALTAYLGEKLRRYSLKGVFLKSLVSVLFVAEAVCAWYAAAAGGRPDPLGLFVIPGLVFGMLGDVWLDLKYVFPREDRPFTYAGFVSFGIGHLLYCTGLILRFASSEKPLFVLAPLLLSLLLSLGNARLEKPMKLSYGEFRTVVIAYGALLFSTVLLSGSLALEKGFRCLTLNLFFLGAVLFALSDLILSGTYFGRGKERPADLLLNYLSYYPAQFLIAYSLLYL